MADKIVDMAEAREQKRHEQKAEKLEDIRDRFSKAMGMKEKPKNRLAAWKRKKKKDSKPKPDGW
ncbi:MAG: tRNA (uracil-5-)-methyltransferase [Motiliproteus sp.]|nr:tRNA (uracil-5-)-methyltransferase [Motiliproteus sp.]